MNLLSFVIDFLLFLIIINIMPINPSIIKNCICVPQNLKIPIETIINTQNIIYSNPKNIDITVMLSLNILFSYTKNKYTSDKDIIKNRINIPVFPNQKSNM